MDCIFCKIAAGEMAAKVVYDANGVIAFHDIAPQAPTHVVVIPKKHIATLNDISRDDAGLVGEIVIAAREVAARLGLAKSGYRLVMNCNENGGQTVFHIHCHVLGGRRMLWPPG